MPARTAGSKLPGRSRNLHPSSRRCRSRRLSCRQLARGKLPEEQRRNARRHPDHHDRDREPSSGCPAPAAVLRAFHCRSIHASTRAQKRPHDERCRAAWRRRKRGLSRSRVRVKGNNPPCSSHTTADFALSRCVDRRLSSLLTFTSPRSILLGDVVVRCGLGTMSRPFKPSFANSTPFEA